VEKVQRMSGKGIKKKKWKNKLLNKYRVVVVNDRTFEDVYSFKLNLLNVVGGSTTLIFLLILSTVILLVLTPIKEYIPGYSSSELKQKTIELALKVDSLEEEAYKNTAYIHAVKKALLGEVEITKESIDSLRLSGNPVNAIEHKQPSEKDLELREFVRLEDKYNIFTEETPRVNQVLFSPVDGEVVRKYDPSTYHFGVDFLVSKNTPVKAIAKGTVLFVDWTIKDGHTIIVLHEGGLISVYKHLSTLTKSEYETVKSGEVLGLHDGEKTESTTEDSQYFHFELWKDNYPLDATLFIDFE
jgi:murein DD-endopeptidase MepM/ murein hydrolase activator NlpD